MRYQTFTGQGGVQYVRIDGPITATKLGDMVPTMSRTDKQAADPTKEYGMLLVTCYCEEELVRVSELDICRGKTDTCGRPGCQPLEEVQ